MAQTLVAPAPPVEEGPLPRLWTREEYHRMAQVGLLPEGPGTELIDGQIYVKMPQGRAHAIAIRLVCLALQSMLGDDFDVAAQAPLPLSVNEPEPDVLVLRGGPRDYEDRDPDPRSDVVLVVEVSDSSLEFDRRRKALLYGSHGVPEYWVVNLRDRTLEVRKGPHAEGYAETRAYAERESLPVGNGTLTVADVLPRRAEGATGTGGEIVPSPPAP